MDEGTDESVVLKYPSLLPFEFYRVKIVPWNCPCRLVALESSRVWPPRHMRIWMHEGRRVVRLR